MNELKIGNFDVVKEFGWLAKEGTICIYGRIGGIVVIRYIDRDDELERFAPVYYKNAFDGWVKTHHSHKTYEEAILDGMCKGDNVTASFMYKLSK